MEMQIGLVLLATTAASSSLLTQPYTCTRVSNQNDLQVGIAQSHRVSGINKMIDVISKIGEVEDDLNSLDSEIAHVQEQISQTEKEISTAEGQKAADVKKIQRLYVKADRQRDKENKLREKENKLREKENKLREELSQLREQWKRRQRDKEKENKLREKENKLREELSKLRKEKNKRRPKVQIPWKTKVLDGRGLSWNQSQPLLLKIEETYHSGSGLTDGIGDVLLYRRDSFNDAYRFIQDQVIVYGSLGYILGPPGTGKSAVAFAFAVSENMADWTVIWVRLSRDTTSSCLIFEGNKKLSASCTTKMLKQLLDQPNTNKKRLLIVDGFVRDEADHVKILKTATGWRNVDRSARRLLIVSSMTSRGRCNEGDDITNSVEEFAVYSWTKDEYSKALSIPEFRNSVITCLDAAAPGAPLHEIIEQKYYYAGGSARYMFRLSTSKVIRRIQGAIESISSSPPESSLWSGLRGGNAVNRLFAVFPENDNCGDRNYQTLVSGFAISEVGLQLGPAALTAVLWVIRNDLSGSGAGALFETMFCCLLQSGGVWLTCTNSTSVQFERSLIRRINIKSESCQVQDEEWLKPMGQTNPGYDLVYVNRKAGMVRFIQMARGTDHELNLEPCRLFITKLVDCPIRIVDFLFVVRKELLGKFRIPLKGRQGQDLVKGRGALSTWRIASQTATHWEVGSEHDQVCIVGMKDIF